MHCNDEIMFVACCPWGGASVFRVGVWNGDLWPIGASSKWFPPHRITPGDARLYFISKEWLKHEAAIPEKTQSKLGEARLGWMDQSWFNWFQARPRKYSSSSLVVARTEDFAEVSGKGFLVPGNGKGNWKSHSRFTGKERELENATGREGKFEARNPGNPRKSRESYKKQGIIQNFIYFHASTSHTQNCK